MTSSYICLLVHFVWSTAGRRPFISDQWRDRLYAYLGGIVRNKNGKLLAVGGTADHVHLYVSLPSTISLAECVNTLKSNSSVWVSQTIPNMATFAWQKGYGAFSVSKSGEEQLVRYIENQQEHHHRRTFQEELLALLEKHGIEYDEKYLWG